MRTYLKVVPFHGLYYVGIDDKLSRIYDNDFIQAIDGVLQQYSISVHTLEDTERMIEKINLVVYEQLHVEFEYFFRESEND